jgi:ATP-binding cassette, subfamily B, bacterial
MRTSEQRSVEWRIWQEVRPHWRHLAGLFALGFLAPPLALLTPLPLKIAVDSVLDHQPLPQFLNAMLPETARQSPATLLIVAVTLVIAIALLSQLRDFASTLLSTYTGEKLLRGFRASMFRHVQRLSLSYHDSKGVSDSIYRIQNDATSMQKIAVEGIVPLITSALTLAAMVFVTIQINWRLAVIALSVSPVVFLVSRRYRRRLRKQSHNVKKIESAAMAVVHEVLGALRVVKAFSQEERENERFSQKSNEGMKARVRQAFAEGRFGIVVTLLTAVGTAGVLYIGVRDIQRGALTAGDLLYVMGLLTQLYSPLKTLNRKMGSMQTNLAGAERAFALLDETPEVLERPNPCRLVRASGAMAFREVSFAYDRERPVLRDVSIEIEPGTCLGIIGATGAGKTTLMNLLMRFFDPTAGAILLDGVDLREYKLADLRNQFAMVLQEPVLFSTSIAENIAYARSGALEQEIIAAAKAANAHDFIVKLPQGYETLVGERGMRLSGGERQRMSIARAFLKDAPVLILDEPTSSVDANTEFAIVQAMERLTRGRTTFIITHRPSALQHCDLVLKMEDGRVGAVEPGPVLNATSRRAGRAAVAVEARDTYV